VKLYFFEAFVLVNLAVIVLFGIRSLPIVGDPVRIVGGLLLSMCVQAILGVAVRSVVALVRRDRGYFRVLRSGQWLRDTARLIVGGALIIFAYGWIKLVVPLYHPALFDQALWDLDQTLFFGISPAVFFLDLFGEPSLLRIVDWSYANIFLASTLLAGAYFFSEPSRRIRVAFFNGYALLWITGAWLYLLVPSLGPAYRFPEIWLAQGESLKVTQYFQALLMKNYRDVLRAGATGEVTTPIRIAFGIGAFPSLHVGFQTFVFLWMRRLWTAGEVLFGLFVLVIFLGSMITGWHYLIDGLVGLALGWVCFAVFGRRARLKRWLELRRA